MTYINKFRIESMINERIATHLRGLCDENVIYNVHGIFTKQNQH